jgi:uncharacterized FAD-dependent dehydrogenase
MFEYRIPELKLPLGHDEAAIRARISRELGTRPDNIASFRVEKKSFDARDRENIRVVYAIRVSLNAPIELRPKRGGSSFTMVSEAEGQEAAYEFPAGKWELAERPIVVGAGPAGLFAALLLAEQGYRPLVLERGDPAELRAEKVREFWESGKLDPDSNIQFGEGGAGTFSDGKLNSTGKDKLGRNAKVLAEFIEAGAPEEIAYSNKPHIGTDYLLRVVAAMRRKIESLGGELRFRSRVSSLVVEDGHVVGVIVNGGEEIRSGAVALAPGHGARDLFESLERGGIPMEQKAFAIGVRVEHPEEMIARNQYGEAWKHPGLPVADYKLTHRAADGRGVYSFCMCPGGAVVNASSEGGHVVCNGMSDFARDGRNANSAIVVQVGPGDFGPGGPLAGLEFQRRWEALAFASGGGDLSLPVQTLADFAAGRASAALGSIEPDIRGLWRLGEISGALPPYVARDIVEAMAAFDRKIKGFGRPDTVLVGVETRTSSPLRILRDEACESPLKGLFPCGEGAGYSGGIMSSAVDGIKVAEAIATGSCRRTE